MDLKKSNGAEPTTEELSALRKVPEHQITHSYIPGVEPSAKIDGALGRPPHADHVDESLSILGRKALVKRFPETADAQKRATHDGRFYGPIAHIDGTPRYYPSVTTILGDVKVGYQLEAWKAEQSATLGVEGARFDMLRRMHNGTLVHEAIERLNKGQRLSWDEYPDKANDDFVWKRIARYVQWYESARPEIIATEMTVFSHEGRFAGTCDLVMRLGGRVMVLDYKTSKQVTRDHEIQVSAYAHAVDEMFPELASSSIDGRISAAVLALNTTHKVGYHCKEVEDIERAWGHFSHRRQVFDDHHPDFSPKVDLLPEEFALEITRFDGGVAA